jgi:hypothetical protein
MAMRKLNPDERRKLVRELRELQADVRSVLARLEARRERRLGG